MSMNVRQSEIYQQYCEILLERHGVTPEMMLDPESSIGEEQRWNIRAEVWAEQRRRNGSLWQRAFHTNALRGREPGPEAEHEFLLTVCGSLSVDNAPGGMFDRHHQSPINWPSITNGRLS